MSSRPLRRYILGITALGLAGVAAELAIGGHYGAVPQIIPFVTCALGLVGVVWHFFQDGRTTRWALRGTMVIVAASGAFGVFEHIEHNAEFVAEIHPTATLTENWMEIITGANPILAPAALVLLAALGWAGTWRDPQSDLASTP